MRIILYLSFVFVLFVSCNTNAKKKVERRLIDNFIVESIFVDDTTYDGITKYYSKNGVLQSKVEMDKGLLDGTAINYYSNGNIHDSMNYSNGYKDGFHYVFDIDGKLQLINYYYFDRSMGPRSYYRNGQKERFDFISFDGALLFNAFYDSSGRMTKSGGEVINVRTAYILENDEEKMNLTVYLPKPPGVRVKYSVGAMNDSTKETQLMREINHERPFYSISLSKLISNKMYYISADYYDSTNKFHEVYVQPIAWIEQ